jgi:hypothetical protein
VGRIKLAGAGGATDPAFLIGLGGGRVDNPPTLVVERARDAGLAVVVADGDICSPTLLGAFGSEGAPLGPVQRFMIKQWLGGIDDDLGEAAMWLP